MNDVSIYINDFASPINTESLKIENCNILTISTSCTAARKSMHTLHIVNIKKLIFVKVTQDPMLPATVLVENVSYIDSIPEKTFQQINKATYPRGCFQQTNDFQNISFKNVTINTVEPSAFIATNNFKNFSFSNVKINHIRADAIKLKLDLSGTCEVRNSTIKLMEYLAMVTTAKTIIFTGNYFAEILPNGIGGTFENFYFIKNVVETLQAHALSLLGTNIFILDNKFSHLRGNALEKLSPGLLQYSGHSFGKLKFIYDFSKNELNFVDAAALHPDYVSYENVQTDMMFSRNKFLCTCENLAWMFSPLSHGPDGVQLEDFYKMILDESYANTCSTPAGKSCKVPLKSVTHLIKCGKCLKNVTLESICDGIDGFEEKNQSETTTDSFDVSSEAILPGEMQTHQNKSLDSSAGVGKRFITYVNVFGLIAIWYALQ
ncbi:hypothetical protein YQE_08263, partial [Dendroctonus ponderosae]